MRLALGGQQVPHLEFVSLTDCSLPGCLQPDTQEGWTLEAVV